MYKQLEGLGETLTTKSAFVKDIQVQTESQLWFVLTALSRQSTFTRQFCLLEIV